jgi:hypothetical protein
MVRGGESTCKTPACCTEVPPSIQHARAKPRGQSDERMHASEGTAMGPPFHAASAIFLSNPGGSARSSSVATCGTGTRSCFKQPRPAPLLVQASGPPSCPCTMRAPRKAHRPRLMANVRGHRAAEVPRCSAECLWSPRLVHVLEAPPAACSPLHAFPCLNRGHRQGRQPCAGLAHARPG